MKLLSPVVWSEGMHLAQHHFQQQGRYFQDATAFALSTLFSRPYGLLGCELDRDALRNGTVSLLHARGVMPDGLPFHFPDDELPEPLEIGDLFSPTQDAHLVLLVIPSFRSGGSNCGTDTGPVNGTRYRARMVSVPDETTGQDDTEITLARKNFRLVLGGAGDDVGEGMVSLPIARVRRDGSGRFMFDPGYVPPSLQIGASPRLLELVQRLTELLGSKAEELSSNRGRPDGATELTGFWLAHSVHTSLAPLRNHLEHRSSHPERLFLELSRLAGALCTFGMEAHPRDLPVYDHDDPGPGFEALDRHVRQHLEVVLPTRCVPIRLTAASPPFHTAAVPDRRSFAGAFWYLGVRSGLGRGDTISRVPELIKFCSEKFISELVRRGMDGLRLEHEPSPPSTISPRPGSEYFRITTAGPCWDSITDTAAVGAYVPGALPEAELELLVVLKDES